MKPKVQYTLEAFAAAEHYCYNAFKEYQKAVDNLDIIKEHSKDFLAGIMTEIEQQNISTKISDTKLDRLARSTPKWKEFREGYKTAVQEHGEARVKYFSTIRHFDCIQSGLAYKRTELQKLGA